MHYSDEFKQQALHLAEEIGITKASQQMGINTQTVYKWRRAKSSQDNALEPNGKTTKAEINEPVEQIVLPALTIDLERELEEQKTLNKAIQQTIEYLIEENTALRQQCERYLQAISMISQR